MFHSNQILDITCEHQDLAKVIDFAVKLYSQETDIFTRDDGRVSPAVTLVSSDFWVFGTGSMQPYKTGPNRGHGHGPGAGWQDLPFDYDPEIIARVAIQWLNKHPPDGNTAPMIDGSIRPGARVRAFDSAMASLPRAWDSSRAILAVTPCWLEYHK